MLYKKCYKIVLVIIIRGCDRRIFFVWMDQFFLTLDTIDILCQIYLNFLSIEQKFK